MRERSDMEMPDLHRLVQEAVAATLASVSAVEHGDLAISPARVYDAREVAGLLRLDRHRSVYEIPEAELPRRRVGPKGGAVRYLGLDLIRYLLGLPPVEPEEALSALGGAAASPEPPAPGASARTPVRPSSARPALPSPAHEGRTVSHASTRRRIL